jgi:hypothetical protein
VFPAVPKGATAAVINAANPLLTIPATMWNVDSFYDALQINVVQRISHGLSFQAVYAWAKAIDDGSSEVNNADNFNTADNPYPFDPRFNRGFADWDVPQHLAFNFDWLAPSPHLAMAAPRFLLSVGTGRDLHGPERHAFQRAIVLIRSGQYRHPRQRRGKTRLCKRARLHARRHKPWKCLQLHQRELFRTSEA